MYLLSVQRNSRVVAVCSPWISVPWPVPRLFSSRVWRTWGVGRHRDHRVARENKFVFSAGSQGISARIVHKTSLSVQKTLSEAPG